MNNTTAIETIRALKHNAENDSPQYDYGWDAALDKAIEALAELEKPVSEDALIIARGFCNGEYPYTVIRDMANKIQQYAESYHAAMCAKCKAIK